MSFSASDLQSDIDGLLEELGYEICGDDGEGWTWRFGEHKPAASSVSPSARLFDEAAEATRAAMHDLVGCIDDILGTGRTVVERWSNGDLAEATRELSGALKMLDPTAKVRDRGEASAHRRRVRLLRLIAEGLTFDDCVEAFGAKSLDDDRILLTALHLEGDLIHVMDRSVIREDLGQPGEAHALVWLRISDPVAQS